MDEDVRRARPAPRSGLRHRAPSPRGLRGGGPGHRGDERGHRGAPAPTPPRRTLASRGGGALLPSRSQLGWSPALRHPDLRLRPAGHEPRGLRPLRWLGRERVGRLRRRRGAGRGCALAGRAENPGLGELGFCLHRRLRRLHIRVRPGEGPRPNRMPGEPRPVLRDAQLIVWSAAVALVLLLVGTVLMVAQP